MEDDKQQEFIAWLGDKLQASDQKDLQKKIQSLGDDGVRKAYDQFLSEKSQDDSGGVASKGAGGRLEYIKCLQAYARGGAMEAAKCGCGGKMKEGGLVNRGKLSIKKDQGSVKDSDVDSTAVAKKQYIGHKDNGTEAKDKPSAKEKGGNMSSKERLAMNLMMKDKQKSQAKKHQVGGVVTYADGPQRDPSLMVDKADGTVGPWGNRLPQLPPKNYLLKKSEVSPVNEINQNHIDHLRKMVPNFDRIVGAAGEDRGMMRYGADQSDIIRNLLTKYPIQQQQNTMANKINPQAIGATTLAKGGRLEQGDTSNKASSGGGGGGGGGIKTIAKSMPTMKSGDRKDAVTKEKNPGTKEYMTFGKKAKNKTAITKVPTGQAGGKMAGIMGGMMSGAGVRKPKLSPKTPMGKDGLVVGDGATGYGDTKGDDIGKPMLNKKKVKATI